MSFPTIDYSYFRFLGSYIPTHFLSDLSASTYPYSSNVVPNTVTRCFKKMAFPQIYHESGLS